MITGVIFGCFDLFHAGHFNALKECSRHCDYLYVCVLSDEAVKKYKRTPIWGQDERRKKIDELDFVDSVLITDRKIIFGKYVDIDVFFVSEDYKGKRLFCVPESRYDDIIWIPYTKGVSTSSLIEKSKCKEFIE